MEYRMPYPWITAGIHLVEIEYVKENITGSVSNVTCLESFRVSSRCECANDVPGGKNL